MGKGSITALDYLHIIDSLLMGTWTWHRRAQMYTFFYSFFYFIVFALPAVDAEAQFSVPSSQLFVYIPALVLTFYLDVHIGGCA